MNRKYDPPKLLVGTESEKEGLVEVVECEEMRGEKKEGGSGRQCE